MQNSESKKAVLQKAVEIKPINAHIIPAMKQHMLLKAYSISTIKTYMYEMRQFLGTLSNNAADNLQNEQLKRYLVYVQEDIVSILKSTGNLNKQFLLKKNRITNSSLIILWFSD